MALTPVSQLPNLASLDPSDLFYVSAGSPKTSYNISYQSLLDDFKTRVPVPEPIPPAPVPISFMHRSKKHYKVTPGLYSIIMSGDGATGSGRVPGGNGAAISADIKLKSDADLYFEVGSSLSSTALSIDSQLILNAHNGFPDGRGGQYTSADTMPDAVDSVIFISCQVGRAGAGTDTNAQNSLITAWSGGSAEFPIIGSGRSKSLGGARGILLAWKNTY